MKQRIYNARTHVYMNIHIKIFSLDADLLKSDVFYYAIPSSPLKDKVSNSEIGYIQYIILHFCFYSNYWKFCECYTYVVMIVHPNRDVMHDFQQKERVHTDLIFKFGFTVGY